MGYDINRFKSRLPNEIICCVCFGVLDDPHEVIECGHMFCRNCILKWITDPYYNTATCPVCRRDVNGGEEDIRPAPLAVRQYINRLPVKCDFSDRGCIADVRLADYRHHHSVCPLNPGKPINCNRGCGIRLPPEKMSKHQCELDMCQDAIEWNDIFDYVRLEMKKKNYQRRQHQNHSVIGDSCKKIFTFFTRWLADPRIQYGSVS